MRSLGGFLEETLEGDLTVRWGGEVRDRFISFMKVRGRSREYVKDCVSYLDRYVHEVSSGARE